jgi:hypothetical protein
MYVLPTILGWLLAKAQALTNWRILCTIGADEAIPVLKEGT